MEDAASFKEFQNLLDDVEKSAIGAHNKSWLKYARLVLPHVGLVIFVCFYALFGAWVFYSIESPHEDRLKVHGIRRVQELRRQLVKDMLNIGADIGQPKWMANTNEHLLSFGEDLFRAYKEHIIRYEDIRPISSAASNSSQPQQQPQPSPIHQSDPRLRRHFSKSRSEGKMWTPSSALFFAATTMATIGYGNIVPMTNHGRIACIIFALFGAPLAIITIGDLGKFLSECTIWLYRRLKDKSIQWHFRMNQFWVTRKKRRRRRLKEYFVPEEYAMDGRDMEMGEGEEEQMEMNRKENKKEMRRMAEAAERERRRMDEWQEEEKNETEVPVLVVFAILLLYIALGGVLFAILESWTYMDAFYYCFVSLTTIGFGDLVPDRHEYIVLMLLYLGIGLAVTTMCIDLVGVQYIQKIHYFGRKFKGTDILQILRRRRMLERRIAMGEGKEFIEFVIKQEREALNPLLMQQPKAWVQPVVLQMATQLHGHEDMEEDGEGGMLMDGERLSLRSEQEMEEEKENTIIAHDVLPSANFVVATEMEVPKVLESCAIVQCLPPASSSPLTVSPSPPQSDRSIIYDRLTEEDQLPTEHPLPELDPSSLDPMAFPSPLQSPDLWKIGDAARASRRVASCPALPSLPVSLPPHNLPPHHHGRRRRRTLACPSQAFHELLRLTQRCVVIVLPSHQSISPRFCAQTLGQTEGGLKLLGNGKRVGNWVDEEEEEDEEEAEAAELIHHLDVLKRRVSFFDHQLEILQAPKAPQRRFIGQPVWFYRRRRSLHQQGESGGAGPPPSATSTSASAAPADQQQQQQQSPPSAAGGGGGQMSGHLVHQKSTTILENYQPVLKRKRRERLARRYDPLNRLDWLALSPRIAVTEEGVPATMAEITQKEQELPAMKDLPSQLLVSEHPIYQHLANLEVGDLRSSIADQNALDGGNLSSRQLAASEVPTGPRYSLESLAISLKAMHRWKDKRMSIAGMGGPSSSTAAAVSSSSKVNVSPQIRMLMGRRTSLGGSVLAQPIWMMPSTSTSSAAAADSGSSQMGGGGSSSSRSPQLLGKLQWRAMKAAKQWRKRSTEAAIGRSQQHQQQLAISPLATQPAQKAASPKQLMPTAAAGEKRMSLVGRTTPTTTMGGTRRRTSEMQMSPPMEEEPKGASSREEAISRRRRPTPFTTPFTTSSQTATAAATTAAARQQPSKKAQQQQQQPSIWKSRHGEK